MPLSAFMPLANDTLMSCMYLRLHAFTHAFRWLAGWYGASVAKIGVVHHIEFAMLHTGPCPLLLWIHATF